MFWWPVLQMAGHPMCDGSGKPLLGSRDDLDSRQHPEIPYDSVWSCQAVESYAPDC